MSDARNARGDDRESCTTTGSFTDHGIDDGTELLRRTYYRLAGEQSAGFDPNETFFEDLKDAFVWAYLESTNGTDVPDHVLAATDDALAAVREQFSGDHGADLRTDVIPAFYRSLAGFHCAYRDDPV